MSPHTRSQHAPGVLPHPKAQAGSRLRMQPRRFERYRTTEEYSAGRRPRHLQAGTSNRQGFAGRLIIHGARGIMPVPVPDNRDVHGCKRLQEVHKERDCRPNRDPCRAGSASKLLCRHGQREHRAAAAGSCRGDCHASIARCWLAARQPVLAHRTTQDRWCKTTAAACLTNRDRCFDIDAVAELSHGCSACH